MVGQRAALRVLSIAVWHGRLGGGHLQFEGGRQ